MTAALVIVGLAIVLGWLTWANSDTAINRGIRRDAERRAREEDAMLRRMLDRDKP